MTNVSPKFKIKLGEKLPDFTEQVTVPLANGDDATIGFTFRHLRASEVDAILKDGENNLSTAILKFTSGWDLDDEYNEANLKELLDMHPGIQHALIQRYIQALAGVKVKN